MGGYLDGEGEPGRGAVFTLVIPLPPATGGLEQGAAPDTADPAGALPPSFRVLVSEDHPANRMVLEILLSQIGAEFHSTEDGQQACEACEVERFDLILMDMQMPVMDGLTAIRQIRRREQERGVPRTPIILVTANAMPEHRNAGVAAGADGFVTKPISVQALLTAMQKLEMAA